MIWSNESPQTPAKIALKWAKDEPKFEIKGGYFDGQVARRRGRRGALEDARQAGAPGLAAHDLPRGADGLRRALIAAARRTSSISSTPASAQLEGGLSRLANLNPVITRSTDSDRRKTTMSISTRSRSSIPHQPHGDQLVELTKTLEDKWGVKAAPVAVAGGRGGRRPAAAAAAEEKTEFTVVLKSGGAQQDPASSRWSARSPASASRTPRTWSTARRRTSRTAFQGRGRGHRQEAQGSRRRGRDQVSPLVRPPSSSTAQICASAIATVAERPGSARAWSIAYGAHLSASVDRAIRRSLAQTGSCPRKRSSTVPSRAVALVGRRYWRLGFLAANSRRSRRASPPWRR